MGGGREGGKREGKWRRKDKTEMEDIQGGAVTEEVFQDKIIHPNVKQVRNVMRWILLCKRIKVRLKVFD